MKIMITFLVVNGNINLSPLMVSKNSNLQLAKENK